MSSEYAKYLKYLKDEDEKKPNKRGSGTVTQHVEKLETKMSDFKALDDHNNIPQKIQYKHIDKSKVFDNELFENLMREKLIESHRRVQNYKRPYVSVSELYTCIRKCYYSRMGYEIDLSKEYNFSYLYLINPVGNKVHDLIQDLYPFTETEKTVITEKYKVKGRVDAIMGQEAVVELKTIDEHKFKYEYIKEHYYQGVIYAYILNSDYGYNIRTITITYIIRNLKKIYSFDLKIDNELAVSLLKNADVLHSSLSNNDIPDPINATDEQCRYCSYKKYCEEETKYTKQNSDQKKRVFLL